MNFGPDFPVVPLISALAENETLQEWFLRATTIMDEDIASGINSLSKNVDSCGLWLNEQIPIALMDKITNFTKNRYNDGRRFYE